jgi:hypothetical protein
MKSATKLDPETLLRDPPRPPGRANLAYVRVIRLGLRLANERYYRETDRGLYYRCRGENLEGVVWPIDSV